MRKLTIVMTYCNRQKQLLKTLDSFRQYTDFSVVIVDDNSPEDIQLPQLPFDITILKLRQKNWICPAPVFNFGFIEALKHSPDAIIIQNAECYHKGDILGYVRKNLTERNYMSFAAYSLGANEDIDLQQLNKKGASGNGDSAWYNHSIYRPEALHFCCAITANNLCKINGFDENFSQGLGYEDNYLIHQIRTLGLFIKIVDAPFVFHQYHYDQKVFTFNQEIYDMNAMICRQLMAKKIYRAQHFITADLC
ncbi:MAG: glycosyltransferase [Rikenellaceae bacterium]